MIVFKSLKISSTDDMELNIKRKTKLEFKLCYDDEKEIEAILVLIQGTGSDANDNFLKFIMENLAKKHNIALIAPNYFGIHNRPQVGAELYFDEMDKKIIYELCADLNVAIDEETFANNTPREILSYLNTHIHNLKQTGYLTKDYAAYVHSSLKLKNDEYQNWGIMPAMDIINAILHIKKNPPFKTGGGSLSVVVSGDSYGGYLALMCAKIAPWVIDGVIDNSGSGLFSWRMIGFGKELDFKAYSACGAKIDEIYLLLSDKTFWTTRANSPYFFSQSRRDIRYILNPTHLETLAKATSKIIFVSYHSQQDTFLAPYNEKVELFELLKKLKFDATLHLIKDESELDGKFIKSLEHGLGIPFKALINKEFPPLLEKIKKQGQKACEKSIRYVCYDLVYTFSEKNHKIKLQIDDR
ncbi:DUF2920 family protein [Campylobacter helveticus]|uniref:DUF2920 family protein n=2 Tax=Campylobacter helveticus TaxID=28898 RepID=UPI0011175063|nr:DUF2920 family protein [Campylobacter helveticus]TNH34359.1 DUF2920 family protein [Campylobacter helveticus]TNH36429.1 DUF2920 family protein [Campylobacter helveticus]